jgi:hypothetical protein
MTLAAWIALAAALALAALNYVRPFDADDKSPGTLGSTARYGPFVLNKVLAHAILSFALCFVLVALGASLLVAAAGTLAVGVAWELSQRHVRWFDLLGDALGVAAALLFASLRT